MSTLQKHFSWLGLVIVAVLIHSNVVLAACKSPNDTCHDEDTKTSAMAVDHSTVAGVATPTYKVEPDNSEDWEITAYWEDGTTCDDTSETVDGTITWTGSAWSVSGFTPTANIDGVSVCMVDSCNSGTLHSWKYKIIVDVADPHRTNAQNLKEVKYETTSVDSGDTLYLCSETGAVSPTSQTFTGWDIPFGGNWSQSARCQYSCSIVGGSMSIGYN